MREMLSARECTVELSNPILISWLNVNLNQIENRRNSLRTPNTERRERKKTAKQTNERAANKTVNNPSVDCCEEINVTEAL